MYIKFVLMLHYLMIEAVQTLFGKKWLSSSALENREVSKIEKAGKSAIRFLSKYGM